MVSICKKSTTFNITLSIPSTKGVSGIFDIILLNKKLCK